MWDGAVLFPLDGGWGFRGDIVDDTIHAANFVDYPRGNAAQNLVGQVAPIGSHEVFGLDCPNGQGVLIGAGVTHDANTLDR